MQPSQSFDQLYVFGDSLSDTGTVFRMTGGTYPPNPPYFQGRYSNGRVWVEYLADRLQLPPNKTQNFACGGATTGSNGNMLVPSLLNQVQGFVEAHPQTDPKALYVLWAGANDYLQGTSSAASPVENVVQSISALAKAGARKFLVANLPNLGELPATRASTNAGNLHSLTNAHNQGLRRSLKQLRQQYADLQIATLDANALYQNAIDHPANFGLHNVLSACVSDSRPCRDADQFLFWDGIHPTTAAHRIISDAAFTAIQEAKLLDNQPIASLGHS